MKIADRDIGPGHPCFLVAEVSGNHNGSLDRALALIEAARLTGADAVKFQAFTMEEILGLRGEGQAPAPWDAFTKRDLYERVITPADWFPTLFEVVRGSGLIAFSSVFGLQSLALLESLACPLYKIAKPEHENPELLKAVRATGKPILASGREIYCPGSYPCQPSDLRLGRLALGYFGLSCHCPDPLVGPVAVAYGAHYLEAHLTLDDGVPTLDDCVNFTASRFRELVQLIRRAEVMR